MILPPGHIISEVKDGYGTHSIRHGSTILIWILKLWLFQIVSLSSESFSHYVTCIATAFMIVAQYLQSMCHVAVWNQQHGFHWLISLYTFHKQFYLSLTKINFWPHSYPCHAACTQFPVAQLPLPCSLHSIPSCTATPAMLPALNFQLHSYPCHAACTQFPVAQLSLSVHHIQFTL
jgi:hypothetical protein